uniref:hypothetical protein n=1 Tax=Trichocoleus desertorum TaxID=1481672 RepID=UPI0025B46791|nr:hypothetical protein [Trichocoleus desertorum]
MANSAFSFGDPPRSTSAASSSLSPDLEIWTHLKQAIATSSGFQRWQLEGKTDENLDTLSLDHRVQRYLRETLETLAY